jgi:two-component system NtrC family sensor kinase
MLTRIFFIVCFYACVISAFADDGIVYNKPLLKKIGSDVEILNNREKKYTTANVIAANDFYKSLKTTPILSKLNVDTWVRFSIINLSESKNIYFNIGHFNTSFIRLYKESNGILKEIYLNGNAITHPSNNRLPEYVTNLNLQPGSSATYYMHIESYHPVILDMYVGPYEKIINKASKQFFIVAVYSGILLAIFFYNLFLFFITADRSYLLYILNIFFLGFAQFTLSGYMFKYLWLSYPALNYYAVPVASSLAIIFGVLFSVHFLRTKFYTPFFHKALLTVIFFSVISIFASLIHLNNISYSLIVVLQTIGSILIIIASIIIISKGYKPALFYAISWILFLTGLIIFSLRNFDFIPANSFTNYILYIGSAIETVLLSIALADKINVLKKEKDQSHAEALKQARRNQKLVNEQNILLEKEVSKRTAELQSVNDHLSEALNNLKDTQTQLVEAEKMASLGQLTAGIAHEINNPINFVKSNINPLRLDIKDLMEILDAYDELHLLKDGNLKQSLDKIQGLKESMDIGYVQKEIDNLIEGIEEGAERTAEIVRGLRTFSRIDEAELKIVNIHDGISSTIVLLKNSLPYYVKIIKEFNAVGQVECFPGKINQVFMNIITNAIQAIEAKPVKEDEVIIIKTRDITNDRIEISIKDTGIGMTDEIKHRIFEPFFTTKDVGEGTGLGMAIVFKIIQKHSGKINIISAPNEGAEFIITLSHKYQGSE